VAERSHIVMHKSSRHSERPAIAWIYNPWLDLIVGCGAWSVPLLLVSYWSIASNTRAWSVVFYALALFFNYPHYMATIYRAYHREEDFAKYRIFTVHTTALVLLTLVISHYWTANLPWLFTIYLTWSPWHYSGQNYGLFMMFARRAGADPDKGTRQALYGAFVASYLLLFLGFHTGLSSDPLFRSLGIPAAVSRWEELILVVGFVLLSAYGPLRLARQTGWRKLIPSLTLYSSQVLWFVLPATISFLKRIDIPQSRYSSGVMAVMHSAQYLWITSYYARREAGGDTAKAERSWRPLAYFGVLIVGGIGLFVPGPWLASRVLHRDFSASFLIFTALVNIHHFILDGAIWKLGDGRIAALLINSKDRVANVVADAGGSFARAWRWMSGNSTGASRLRVSAAGLLLVLGTIDQARHYLALHSDDLKDLKRAAALDAFDSQLQARLARRELETGNAEEAEVAWLRAIQANPTDPAPRQELLRFLLQQNRFDEALTLTEASLKYAPEDANLMVDRGLLAMQRGHADEALGNWEQALKVAPNQSVAHLYLAHELDREGKAELAAHHYWGYIDKIGQRPEERPAADVLIGIVLRMANCQARSSQPGTALKSYQMAEKLAQQTGQGRLESIAVVNEAPLQAQAGKMTEALRLYRRALELDDSLADKAAASVDWFAYGQFLEQSGFPARTAYACMVKSELIGQSLPAPAVPKSAPDARRKLEKRLGAEAAAIRSNPEPTLRDALRVQR
jgi:tetratricopeptide (TPR) repeat protein